MGTVVGGSDVGTSVGGGFGVYVGGSGKVGEGQEFWLAEEEQEFL